jgi:acetyltransferase-like isoleucine patch superfamily enzyme
MILIKNPITIYIKYIANWAINKIKFNNYYQGYLTFVHNSKVGRYVRLYDFVHVSDSEINNFTYISVNTKISRAKIGKFCSVGPNCLIGWGLHPTKNFVSTHPIFYSLGKQVGITFADKNYFDEFKQISIGNDVWIGAGCIVFDGVTIGDGAIIAAGAVVNKDVPDYAIYGGVPAKLISYRFDDETINLLTKEKWWDNDIKWLKEHFRIFLNIEDYKKYLNNLNDCKL